MEEEKRKEKYKIIVLTLFLWGNWKQSKSEIKTKWRRKFVHIFKVQFDIAFNNNHEHHAVILQMSLL